MPHLNWITDSNLDSCVERLLLRSSRAVNNAKARIQSNVPDPFMMLCLAHTTKVNNLTDFEKLLAIASSSTGISSAIGEFHQKVLSQVSGFRDHNAGYDIESDSRKILAEIKNKHNTMNASNRTKVIEDLKTAVRIKPGYTGYLVIIIPKKWQKYKVKISNRVYEIDGTSFYELVTEDPNALDDLYGVLLKKLAGDIDQDIVNCCKSAFKRGMAND